ncbi:hypothetical protein CEXT_742121 [Caerostris extrusa]|uniref:Uncharacterized protein n=1 Tax=Caerostris extrusa TaxID=172846 RepID=A0AAV4SJ06_CAEEX|nr:hypothetical protein CEXT_742121 [Caerostris extrusa]
MNYANGIRKDGDLYRGRRDHFPPENFSVLFFVFPPEIGARHLEKVPSFAHFSAARSAFLKPFICLFCLRRIMCRMHTSYFIMEKDDLNLHVGILVFLGSCDIAGENIGLSRIKNFLPTSGIKHVLLLYYSVMFEFQLAII